MKRRDAFKLAKNAFSGESKEPSCLSSAVAMGEVVLVVAHDNNTIITLHTETDINRVKTACMIAEQRIAKRKKCKRSA